MVPSLTVTVSPDLNRVALPPDDEITDAVVRAVVLLLLTFTSVFAGCRADVAKPCAVLSNEVIACIPLFAASTAFLTPVTLSTTRLRLAARALSEAEMKKAEGIRC